jgi:hypothetical protein
MEYQRKLEREMKIIDLKDEIRSRLDTIHNKETLEKIEKLVKDEERHKLIIKLMRMDKYSVEGGSRTPKGLDDQYFNILNFETLKMIVDDPDKYLDLKRVKNCFGGW